jgi:L-rhamnose-H+ transport protein
MYASLRKKGGEESRMEGAVTGTMLAVLSGVMNGSFTLPMRFLGRWEWENVWSLFIVTSCLILPTFVLASDLGLAAIAVRHAPASAVAWAIGAGFIWGFGAIMFGQSVSAIGISLANTLVLAISSALGSLLPMAFLHPRKLASTTGHQVLLGVGVEILGIVACGYAGRAREADAPRQSKLVGRVRPFGVGLLLASGAGLLSALFNIGFALAQPIAPA